jgi:SAM-dependent methyltransferase
VERGARSIRGRGEGVSPPPTNDPARAASTARAEKPVRAADETALFLRELIAEAAPGARVLDAGCGPGSWSYAERADLRVTGFDVKFPPGPPPRTGNSAVFRGDLARLALRSETFDLTLCHYVLEHVTELAPSCDELARVTRTGGVLYVAVPRSASFDDRLYRFAGYFAKYALGKIHKRIEHQQRFDLQKLLDLFYARGLILEALALVPAGFSWMNDPRTKGLQGPFTDALAWIHRVLGLDLARDANHVMRFRKTGSDGARRVTHVCRTCGEHVILSALAPWPARWTCPWCGSDNPFGRPR